MTTVLESVELTRVAAAEMLRDMARDQSWMQTPLGRDVLAYLRAKRKRLTPASYRTYESVLATFALHFYGLRLEDFEPPLGVERLEEFLDDRWGSMSARGYNRNLSIFRDYFKFHARRERMHGDPTLPIERAKARGVHRETFSDDQLHAILASQADLRDRLACRLVLQYGLRKGTLREVQFAHFDHVRRHLTAFAKGGKVQKVPIPAQAFWTDLERLILDTAAAGNHYLLPGLKGNQRVIHEHPTRPRSAHGLHDWWYRCLTRAGVVGEGVKKGEKMHKARHTAGQRVLDRTGNLKAVQKLLGHASMTTTADIYVDWDDVQLAASLDATLEGDD